MTDKNPSKEKNPNREKSSSLRKSLSYERSYNERFSMREKEIFHEMRKLRQRFSLRFRLIAIVTMEIVISFLLAIGLDALFVWLLGDMWTVPAYFEIVIIAVLVGVFATYFITRWFIDPIKDVGVAMEKIADGDFDVRLETRSSSKEIREIYSGFNMMAKELQSTEILQTDFVSNVSHEIKTPINAIEGYSMLLQDGDNLTDDQKEYVDKIIFNTNRLSSLTGSILLLSKLENQSIVANKTYFDLDEQIRKSILALEGEWSRKDIDFDIDMDETNFLGNESLLHHIWDNLIGNAIKFSPHSSEIGITLSNLEDRIVFSVTDMGPGLTEEAQKHIFDKFYQADSSHKEKGNGLGLALVKKIIDLEQGEITVKNNPEAGCTFTVTLYK